MPPTRSRLPLPLPLAVLVALPGTYLGAATYGETGECAPDPDAPNPCPFAPADMTGADRVLVGVGRPLVVLPFDKMEELERVAPSG